MEYLYNIISEKSFGLLSLNDARAVILGLIVVFVTIFANSIKMIIKFPFSWLNSIANDPLKKHCGKHIMYMAGNKNAIVNDIVIEKNFWRQEYRLLFSARSMNTRPFVGRIETIGDQMYFIVDHKRKSNSMEVGPFIFGVLGFGAASLQDHKVGICGGHSAMGIPYCGKIILSRKELDGQAVLSALGRKTTIWVDHKDALAIADKLERSG